MFATNGILFNHESPRRGETFVSRKITRAVANILAGNQEKLYLGTLTSRRDWGYAPEYVEAMWRMLQQDRPGDYVVGTGETHSVQEFLESAFEYAGLDWRRYVEIDQRYVRPTDVSLLLADTSRAKRELDWEARIRFDGLVKIMVDADIEAAVNSGEIMYQRGGSSAEMWRLKTVPPTAFNRVGTNLMEGGMDVPGGAVRSSPAGGPRGRDEHP